MRPERQLQQVRRLVKAGQTDRQISETTGIPRRTICDWRRDRNLLRTRAGAGDYRCRETHDFSLLPADNYAYLFGLYRGDGCISHGRRGVYRLRITLDLRYPGIISSCRNVLNTIFPEKTARVAKRRESRCVDVSMWSKHWPCLIPQHGRGPKHARPIRLTGWQKDIVDQQRKAFLRGLIHSDGCRIVATERSGDRVRRAPRYTFSNRSEDIKQLFCESCDALDVKWTRPSENQIAIYRKASVAALDEFVGPKA